MAREAAPRQIALAELPDHVGCEIGVSSWQTIDQARIDAFAAATDDHQWIHVDRDRAEAEMGGTIAHGFLTLSMMSRLAAEIYELTGVAHQMNYGFERLRFTGVVKAGDRIRLRLTLVAVTPKGDGMQSLLSCIVESEGGERPALVADWLTIAFPKR